MQTLTLDGHTLTLADVARFLAGGVRVAASRGALERVERCAAFCDHLAGDATPHYGINTGFGKFARTRVSAEDAVTLQRNLLRSHSAGAGPLLDVATVRLMMLLRANSLLVGQSGVSVALVTRLVEFVNLGITPEVPSYGSVGASGDLAPLAHLSLAIIGEGRVTFGGKSMPAADALAAAGLAPLELRPKEGLALINGTQLMSAVAARELVRTRMLLKTAMAAAAMSIDGYQATDRVFDARLHALKPHPGQIAVAAGFRRLLAGSAIMQAHRDCDRVQDPYSFRCIPQVLGAVLDMAAWIETWVTREINAVTDNPIVFPDDGDVLSGGNFHGEHMAFALDALAIAASEIASIAERRVDKLMEGDGERVPRCLIAEPGLNSGFMIAQYLAAALVSENKIHAHPASVDSIPTSLGFEDHVSMGSIGALKVTRVLDNVARVVAVELLCGAQAVDFHRPLLPGRGGAAARDAVRETVPFLERDAVLAGHIASLEARAQSGEIVRAVEAAVGDILPADPGQP
ncbi:MAG TPA: histidine ammonia-lyase [Candidatus Krumholzibacteria bacterium]|nr:histidine ammonia-lyase [Candidatus Krumholzibacteria bacterium]